MKDILFVGMGGFLGSVLRYGTALFVSRFSSAHWLPLGTLMVNVAGCFGIGLLGGWLEGKDVLEPHMRLFLGVGILGGFTTFSAFGFETLLIARHTHIAAAAANIFLQVGLGIAAAVLGYALGKGWVVS